MRILLLKTKINSQIDTLDQYKPTNTDDSTSPQLQNDEIVKRLNEILSKEKTISPATLKSLSVNYNNKSRWLTSNPLSPEKEEWISTPLLKGQTAPPRTENKCLDCKYKEGLEEVLNMLSVCGFIKKPENGQVEQESPVVSTYTIEEKVLPMKEKEEKKRLSKDMRIRFTGKNGLAHEFYY